MVPVKQLDTAANDRMGDVEKISSGTPPVKSSIKRKKKKVKKRLRVVTCKSMCSMYLVRLYV